MKSGSPFGEEARKRALHAYFDASGRVTAGNAWEHIYRLLLSIDRRTRLAHVMDSNHMQPGGSFHGRAVKFTTLLCEAWGVTRSDLQKQVDHMFQACIAEYLAHQDKLVQRVARNAVAKASEPSAGPSDISQEASEFIVAVTEILTVRLGVLDASLLADVVAEIDRAAEHYFTIEKKRQNVRGEGFEDTLEWLLMNTASVKRAQVQVRKAANQLPGFKRELRSLGKARDKVPKPDLALLSVDGKLTLWIVTAKWSLRQDRLDQFGQEAAFYKDNKIQDAKVDFVLVTNEMDVARLRDVLAPPQGAGGFHFDRVYHVNCDLLEKTHGEKFTALAVYRSAGRLLSVSDLLDHVNTQLGVP